MEQEFILRGHIWILSKFIQIISEQSSSIKLSSRMVQPLWPLVCSSLNKTETNSSALDCEAAVDPCSDWTQHPLTDNKSDGIFRCCCCCQNYNLGNERQRKQNWLKKMYELRPPATISDEYKRKECHLNEIRYFGETQMHLYFQMLSNAIRNISGVVLFRWHFTIPCVCYLVCPLIYLFSRAI